MEKDIFEEAQWHSIVNGYAWVIKTHNDIFYTDSEEVYNKYIDYGYTCIKEYYKGEEITR